MRNAICVRTQTSKVPTQDILLVSSLFCDDEVNRLKIELSSEMEKCKRLEADLSLIIEGRTREVNEINDIIVSLECKLKTTEATNDSLRQLINTKIFPQQCSYNER